MKLIYLLLFLFLNFRGYCDEKKPQIHDIKFIYVHGFGERRFPPAFEKKMKKFLQPLDINCEIETYRWDSQEIDFTKVVYQWNVAKENADKEAKVFAEKILNKYEQEKIKYFIIGYSLGARLISQSFNYCNELKYLGGVYFLGAALPKDFKINSKPLPQGMKIINYYSNYLDHALKISFSNAEGIKAGGEVGFLDETIFQNLRTACTHVYKGGPIQRDYSNLAVPIAYISFFKENIFLDNEEVRLNVEFPVTSGIVNWNDIYCFNNQSDSLLIQQNVNTNHYRAVSISKNGKRTRKAWGKNLHSILKQLNLFTNHK